MNRTPSSGLYEYLDLKPETDSFLNDVLTGLSASPKTLPPKYFYDARGSRIFDDICELPEYYPTRTEISILHAAAEDMAARVGRGAALIEYGSGSGLKTPIAIGALQPRAYVAIDISGEHLRHAVAQLAARFPQVRMYALCADYTRALPLDALDGNGSARKVVFFPGSTIGNFTVPEALDFLRNAREVAGPGGAMLVGVDLKKDSRVLHAAYNDAQGVTAEFNLNLLRRMNRELGANFDITAFEHRAHYDEAAGRIEMHLVSTVGQTVRIAGLDFHFTRGETIHTESSYKYSLDEFRALARRAGFVAEHHWTDPANLFAIHFLSVEA